MTKHTPDWASKEGLKLISNGYLQENESMRQAFERISRTAQKYMPDVRGLEEDLFDIFWRGYMGAASPVFANFGNNRGLSASCYAITVPDSVNGIYSQLKHGAAISQMGGGLGVDLGLIRPAGATISRGGKSDGVLPWALTFSEMCSRISQGGMRRGSASIYLPIEHPDIPQILRSKDHSKGDPSQHLHSNIAVTVTDKFMEEMLAGDLAKVKLFGNCLETALVSGSPYIIFTDSINRQNPECYRQHNLSVRTSNICTEIALHTDENTSFVCILSSLNLDKWDEWKDYRGINTGFTVPQLGIYLLDAVTSDWLVKAKRVASMGRAVRGLESGRPLGLGVMGLHSLYQRRMLPVKSQGARSLNNQINKFMRMEAEKATRNLAKLYGECLWTEGTGRRNTHVLAYAPTRSNSVITNSVTPSIEPLASNYYSADESKGTFTRKNPHLETLLQGRGYNTSEVWESILENNGSVQHLDFLTKHEKDVFKTFREVDVYELIKQNADRQKYVDQAISFNVSLSGNETPQELFDMHVMMWKSGIKSRYYLRSQSAQKKAVVKPNQVTWEILTKPGCPYCDNAKELLQSEGHRYTEYVGRENAHKVIPEGYKFKTFPQIVRVEYGVPKMIGGFDDLVEFFNRTRTSSEGCAACEG